MLEKTLSSNKLKHSYAIGCYMQRYAEERLLDPELGNELFILGYLHDIGDQFTENKKEHAEIGGLILKEQKYKYWKEVYHHGEAEANYDSLALRILNLAELSHTSDGTFVGVDKRLEMLKEKFGANSNEYINSLKLANKIKGQDIKL